MKTRIIGIRLSEKEYQDLIKQTIKLSTKHGKLFTISDVVRLKLNNNEQ